MVNFVKYLIYRLRQAKNGERQAKNGSSQLH